ncbi:MAG: 50S ribosomal protein L35 [Actinobacteria bacterium ADurb.Bin346]|nr:MAG: 50S ribosomal protein L35 [Actinobacteria bacterium ADurb.Bin346]
MPKIKTHRGAAKRFKLTGTGKIVRLKAYKSHILTKKNAKRKRNLGQETEISASDYPRIRRLLGR